MSSGSSPQRLSFRVSNRIAEMPKAAARLESFLSALDAPERARYVANLALEEMLTNIMKYAYAGSEGEHLIELSTEASGGTLKMVFIDDGIEFDPVSAERADISGDISERKVGGLGIHLVKNMVSSMEYQRLHGRNRLEIAVPLKG